MRVYRTWQARPHGPGARTVWISARNIRSATQRLRDRGIIDSTHSIVWERTVFRPIPSGCIVFGPWRVDLNV